VLQPGATVAGKFRIERILGAGGMGTVAVAMHMQLEQRVALKVLHEQAASDPAAVQRFLREARAAAKLRSEHICHVTDVGQLDNGAPYIVMELLEGQDLAALLSHGAMAPVHAIDAVLQACVGLAEAHAHGIVHRDLKPANLFVTRRLDGSPLIKVLDFGIAKAPAQAATGLTQTQAVMGTPGYMAPEQLRSTRDADARADIWALGVILYQALSGRLPFPANSITEFAVKSVMDPPDPIDVDPNLRAVILRCLEKEPAGRFPDIATFAQALAPFGGTQARAQASFARSLLAPATGHADTIAAGQAPVPTTLQIASRATTPTQRPAAAPARKGLLVGAGLLGAAVVGGAVVVAVMSRQQPPAPAAAPSGAPVVAAAPVVVDAAVAPPPAVDAAQLTAPLPVDPEPAAVPTPKRPTTKHPAAHPAVASNDPAVAPYVPKPEPPKPAPQANAPAAEKVAEFEHAIATRHCQHAMTMLPQMGYSTPQYQKYMQDASACATERGKAMQNFQDPSSEPWILAFADDEREMGQADAAGKIVAGYYYGRGAKACQAKNTGDAQAMYAKLAGNPLQTTLKQVCQSLKIELK